MRERFSIDGGTESDEEAFDEPFDVSSQISGFRPQVATASASASAFECSGTGSMAFASSGSGGTASASARAVARS